MERTAEKDKKIPVYVTDEGGTLFLGLAKNEAEVYQIIREYNETHDLYHYEP